MGANDVDWELVRLQTRELVEDAPHWIASLSNVCALLNEQLADINWVGFYLVGSMLDARLPDDVLVLGPFQGKVACVQIGWGKGVCGTAAAANKTQRVDDVHAFAGHIACDAASRSEIVVPMHAGSKVVGVLDIDSPSLARFTYEDQRGLEGCVQEVELLWACA